MAWVRRVRTASGATAVQGAESVGGRRRIIAHVGSAHADAELGVLLEQALQMLADAGQEELDLDVEAAPRKARVPARGWRGFVWSGLYGVPSIGTRMTPTRSPLPVPPEPVGAGVATEWQHDNQARPPAAMSARRAKCALTWGFVNSRRPASPSHQPLFRLGER